ncbi:MAG: four helix bundle protein [Candidatus Berkelbacteria bacterium]|nr:four helix bundle protein [Candidatus Berkelbacteria bacterium]
MENNYKQDFIKRLICFSLGIVKFCGKIREDRNLRPIADQIIRSATSIGANIVEAKAASSKKDYLNYFQIALKSANETKYWLVLLKESKSEFATQADKHLSEAIEITKIISSGILTMKGHKKI